MIVEPLVAVQCAVCRVPASRRDVGRVPASRRDVGDSEPAEKAGGAGGAFWGPVPGEAAEKGAGAFTVICPAHEVRAHLKYLRAFHRRRLRPGPDGEPPRAALADRAEFTQDEATDIAACRRCGLVFRNPRPTDEAVARAYRQDHYGRERLASRVGCLRGKGDVTLAPWFDAYYRAP